jgi:DNA-binding PadR family transcriptional regulator
MARHKAGTGAEDSLPFARQTTSSMVGLLILHRIQQAGPQTGTDLLEWLEETFSGSWRPSRSLVFQLVNRMDEWGVLESMWTHEKKRHERRYFLTDGGSGFLGSEKVRHRAQLDGLIENWQRVRQMIWG